MVLTVPPLAINFVNTACCKRVRLHPTRARVFLPGPAGMSILNSLWSIRWLFLSLTPCSLPLYFSFSISSHPADISTTTIDDTTCPYYGICHMDFFSVLPKAHNRSDSLFVHVVQIYAAYSVSHGEHFCFDVCNPLPANDERNCIIFVKDGLNIIFFWNCTECDVIPLQTPITKETADSNTSYIET